MLSLESPVLAYMYGTNKCFLEICSIRALLLIYKNFYPTALVLYYFPLQFMKTINFYINKAVHIT